MSAIGNITCPDLKYNSGTNSLITSLTYINSTLTSQLTTINNHASSLTSINTTLTTLAPLSSGYTITANALTANGRLSGQTLSLSGNATVMGDVLYGLQGTSLSALTTAVNNEAPMASPSFTGTLTSAGQITAQYPVHISLITPVIYNTSGTALTSPQTTAYTHYYVFWSSNNNKNFTPVMVSGSPYKLKVPFTGLWQFQYTLTSESYPTWYLMYISKNGGGNDSNLTNTDQVFGYQVVNNTTGWMSGSLSATAFLLNTDYVCFGFSLSSGTMGWSSITRILASMTLIQRTA